VFDQPIRMRSVHADHVCVIAMPAEQEDKIVEQLLAAAIPMTPLQRLVGGIGNKDRRSGRFLSRECFSIVLPLSTHLFLDEVGHS
jgi:hypothetical protein